MAELLIDGSQGEGGGQILRTALTLSAITGKPFRIVRIRAGREKPGLRPQHLTAVRAVARVTGAEVEGDRIGSSELAFRPGPVSAGSYQFDVGTAGAVSLILQSLIVPLSLQPSESEVFLSGGTHVPWSPCVDYLQRQWLPLLQPMGLRAKVRLERAGYYPPGGGRARATVKGAAAGGLRPVVFGARGPLRSILLRVVISNLPLHIAERMIGRAEGRLRTILADAGERGARVRSETDVQPADSPGVMFLLLAGFEDGTCCATALGAKGTKSERVADEACEAFAAFLATDATVDEHAADQLLLPCALARGRSSYRTPRITEHLRTNADVIRKFLDAPIDITGEADGPGEVGVGAGG